MKRHLADKCPMFMVLYATSKKQYRYFDDMITRTGEIQMDSVALCIGHSVASPVRTRVENSASEVKLIKLFVKRLSLLNH